MFVLGLSSPPTGNLLLNICSPVACPQPNQPGRIEDFFTSPGRIKEIAFDQQAVDTGQELLRQVVVGNIAVLDQKLVSRPASLLSCGNRRDPAQVNSQFCSRLTGRVKELPFGEFFPLEVSASP